MPHGHCYLWRPDILWLHVGSDGLIALSYFSIPLLLGHVVRRRRAVLPYWWVLALFAAFIFLCGSTHLLSIWTVWHPDYPVEGVVKLTTGIVSAATAVTLAWILPKALQLRSPVELEREIARQTADLRASNSRLREEIEQRETTEMALRASEERYRLKEGELREVSRRKDQFLAILAHELRNPLAPVRNALQILKLAEDEPRKVAATREMMERQLSHMVRLIDDLMDVSRLTRDRLELQKVDTTIAQVLDAAIETSRPAIETAGHRLEVVLPPETLPVHADRLRLAQVFGNLLSNSCKFMEPGGRIRIEARREDEVAVVTVTDSGVGIAGEDLSKLFEMFTQVRRENGSRNGGLGIGLALVRSLISLHGGTVAASSDGLGKGATFEVRLPLAEPNPPSVANERRALPSSSQSAALRVLVADDNLDAAESLATLLQQMGHETRVAGEGRDAVAIAEQFRPQLVFMDLSMPHLDGLEATRQIRARPWGRNIVICALTGFSQDQDRQRSLEAGMDLHLVKPVDPEALTAVLMRS